jgi:hypothetical protein
MLLEYYEEKVTTDQGDSVRLPQKLIRFESFLEEFGFPFPRYFCQSVNETC